MENLNNQPNQNQQVSPENQPIDKKNGRIWIVVTVVALLVVVGVVFAIKNRNSNQNSGPVVNKTETQKSTGKIEYAKRTIYKNGKPSIIINENSKEYPDGSLETIVSSKNKILSHQLYLNDKILSLSGNKLVKQQFKKSVQNFDYKTTGENLLNLVKQTAGIKKTNGKLNGKSVIIYQLKRGQHTTFNPFISIAYAEGDDLAINVYVDAADGSLEKVENLAPVTNQVTEDIVYPEPQQEQSQNTTTPQESPVASPNNEAPVAAPVPTAETPVAAEQTLIQEAPQTETVEIDPPSLASEIVAAIYPLSLTLTATGYNTQSVNVVSETFRIYEIYDQELIQKGSLSPDEFAAEHIKVRVDGLELSNTGDFNTSQVTVDILPDEPLGLVRFKVPANLQAGYHTLEIFSMGSWYLVPSLMIAPPQQGEMVMELQQNVPSTGYLVDGVYKVMLTGKNLSKPLTVLLFKTRLDDKYVEVVDQENLLLNIPETFRPGIYDLTLVQGSQTIYRSNFVSISN